MASQHAAKAAGALIKAETISSLVPNQSCLDSTRQAEAENKFLFRHFAQLICPSVLTLL